jgi:hypothetical protein
MSSTAARFYEVMAASVAGDGRHIQRRAPARGQPVQSSHPVVCHTLDGAPDATASPPLRYALRASLRGGEPAFQRAPTGAEEITWPVSISGLDSRQPLNSRAYAVGCQEEYGRARRGWPTALAMAATSRSGAGNPGLRRSTGARDPLGRSAVSEAAMSCSVSSWRSRVLLERRHRAGEQHIDFSAASDEFSKVG